MWENMGLVRSGHHLLWGHGHGWFRLAPKWFSRKILVTWNWVACRVMGHDEKILDLYKYASENPEEWQDTHQEMFPEGKIKRVPPPEPKCGACSKLLAARSE